MELPQTVGALGSASVGYHLEVQASDWCLADRDLGVSQLPDSLL